MQHIEYGYESSISLHFSVLTLLQAVFTANTRSVDTFIQFIIRPSALSLPLATLIHVPLLP